MDAELSNVLSLRRSEAGKRLAEIMGIQLDQSFDEQLRSEIHMDLLLDSYLHAAKKGFSWQDVCRAVRLMEDMLTMIRVEGVTITNAAATYRRLGVNSGIGNRELTVFTDYFFSTFMQHFKLYQYVFTTKRDHLRFQTSTTVNPPQPPMELKTGKVSALYEYETKMEEINSRKVEISQLEPLQMTDSFISTDTIVSTGSQSEVIDNIIKEVIGKYGQNLVGNVSEAIASTFDDLSNKLEQAALPRPKQLGAPPRFELKSAIPAPKTKKDDGKSARTSAKTERKKSAKAK